MATATRNDQWIWRQQTKSKLQDKQKLIQNNVSRNARAEPVATKYKQRPEPQHNVHPGFSTNPRGPPRLVQVPVHQARQYHQLTLPRQHPHPQVVVRQHPHPQTIFAQHPHQTLVRQNPKPDAVPRHQHPHPQMAPRPHPQPQVQSNPSSVRQHPRPQTVEGPSRSRPAYHSMSSAHAPRPRVVQKANNVPIQNQPIHEPIAQGRYIRHVVQVPQKRPTSHHESQKIAPAGVVLRHHTAPRDMAPHVRLSLYRPKSIEGQFSPNTIREYGFSQEQIAFYESPRTKKTRNQSSKKELVNRVSSNKPANVIIVDKPSNNDTVSKRKVSIQEPKENEPPTTGEQTKIEQNLQSDKVLIANEPPKLQNGSVHSKSVVTDSVNNKNIIIDYVGDDIKANSNTKFFQRLSTKEAVQRSDSDSGVDIGETYRRQRKPSEGSIEHLPLY